MEVLVKKGIELTHSEINQVDEAKKREFGARPLEDRDFGEAVFFLLMEEGKLFALGGLIVIEPVLFDDEPFSLLGIGGILANEKGRGYGGQIVRAVKKYLSGKGKTGIGFCKVHNRGFYEKYSFSVNEDIVKRFVYLADGERMTNKTDDLVLYFDGADHFMKKVLANPREDVLLPRPPDW